MKINSAKFIKGAVGPDELFEDGRPQIAFIGRSNVGKSSVINSIVGDKKMARTSNTPGRTLQLNVFLINRAFYLIDLPGYGYARASEAIRDNIYKLINWYLFKSNYPQKLVVLILDAKVGPSNEDLGMIRILKAHEKNFVIVLNKIDVLKRQELEKQLAAVQKQVGNHLIIPYSANKKTGVGALVELITQR